MSEFSHDSVDDGFHEIQLSGKQLVFLFMATTVVSVIFLCGVLVGRGVHIAQPAEAAQPPAAVHETAPPPSPTPGSVPPPAGDPQPVAQAAPAAQTAAASTEAPAPPAGDELTYRKRLEGEGTPTEEKLKPSDAAKPVDSAKPTTRATTPKASEPTPTTGSARPGKWVVQIVALRDRSAAQSIVQRLSGRGYPAYLVNPSSGAPTAGLPGSGRPLRGPPGGRAVARRLEKEEKFNPWISR